MLFYAAACALGLVSGAAFAWLWLRVVPRGTNQRYWSAMSGLLRDMLRIEETSAFLGLYKRLGILTGVYVGRNLGGAALGCLPMIVLLLTAGAALFDAWDARAPGIAIVPESAAQEVPAPATRERVAHCGSEGACLAFSSLGFATVRKEGLSVPYVVTRADHGDANPLWPFLSDLEAAFFLAFVLSTLAGLLWPARASSRQATSHSSA